MARQYFSRAGGGNDVLPPSQVLLSFAPLPLTPSQDEKENTKPPKVSVQPSLVRCGLENVAKDVTCF